MIKYISLKVFFVFTVGLILLPFAITILFSAPSADDFSMAMQSMSTDSNIFIAAWKVAVENWFTHGGGIPFNMLQCLLNPIMFFDATSYMYGCILLLLFLSFIIVMYILFRVVLKYWFNCSDNNCINVYYCFFLFCFLNTGVYTEVYYWFVGNSYLWELEFSLINQILIIMFFRKYQNFWFGALVSVFGFVACFGYQVALFSGFVYLFEFLNFTKINKKAKIIYLLPLLFMVFGGRVSLFAPGNFVRHAVENAASNGINVNSGIDDATKETFNRFSLKNVFTSLIFSCENFLKCYISIVGNPFAILIFIMSVLFGYMHPANFSFRSLGWWFLAVFIMILFTIFPVALGYGRDDFPNRVLFYVTFGIVFYTSLLFVMLGSCLNCIAIIKNKHIYFALTFTFLIFVFSVAGFRDSGVYKLYDYPYFYTASQISNCRNDKAEINKTFNKIKYFPDDDVVLKRSECYINQSSSKIIVPLSLDVDPNHWCNSSTAYCLGKNSIRVE